MARTLVNASEQFVAASITASLLASGVAASNLGFTPLNKAGDTSTALMKFQGPVFMGSVGSSNLAGSITAIAALENAGGMAVGWNYSNGTGEVDLIANGATATGGFALYNMSNTGTMTKLASLDTSGNFTATGNVTGYSDPRLKKNFKIIEDPDSILAAIDGGTFYWRKGFAHTSTRAGKKDYGILADQVKKVMPEIVIPIVEAKGVSYDTVDYTKLSPVLIEASKKAKRRIDELERKNSALEKRISDLEKSIGDMR